MTYPAFEPSNVHGMSDNVFIYENPYMTGEFSVWLCEGTQKFKIDTGAPCDRDEAKWMAEGLIRMIDRIKRSANGG